MRTGPRHGGYKRSSHLSSQRFPCRARIQLEALFLANRHLKALYAGVLNGCIAAKAVSNGVLTPSSEGVIVLSGASCNVSMTKGNARRCYNQSVRGSKPRTRALLGLYQLNSGTPDGVSAGGLKEGQASPRAPRRSTRSITTLLEVSEHIPAPRYRPADISGHRAALLGIRQLRHPVQVFGTPAPHGPSRKSSPTLPR